MSALRYALRFISGKYQGGEFPLLPQRQLIIGRADDIDLVLVDDMVSRKHARITTSGDQVEIEDLDSTNGIFVNGVKVLRAMLRVGDRVLIGSSIIKLGVIDQITALGTDADARRKLAEAAAAKRTAGIGRPMMGAIEEIPLPDILQLLSTSLKSGVLCVNGPTGLGKIFLRKGQIYYAALDDFTDMKPRKALFRILTWSVGSFHFDPPDGRSTAEELTDPTTSLLMDAMHELDETNRLAPTLPSRTTMLEVADNPQGTLVGHELDIMPLVLRQAASLQSLLDGSPHTDWDSMKAVASLLTKNYLRPQS